MNRHQRQLVFPWPGARDALAPALALTAAMALGCGPTPSDDGGLPDAADQVDAPPVGVDASTIDAPPPPENASVYAHSEGALYRIDPETLAVQLIGDFQWPNGVDSMTDIAIDQNGRMIGVSFDSVYEVDEITGACTYLAALQGGTFNGLSFIPDPNNPNQDILVGADQNGDVYQVDPQTGANTLVGNYGGGYISSGDLVSVVGAGTFATVTTVGGNTDQLALIDTANSYTATIIGDTGFDAIWGLGYWKNQVYGFSDNSQFLLIDVATGAATVEQNSGVNWWGAGVTTLAPIIE